MRATHLMEACSEKNNFSMPCSRQEFLKILKFKKLPESMKALSILHLCMSSFKEESKLGDRSLQLEPWKTLTEEMQKTDIWQSKMFLALDWNLFRMRESKLWPTWWDTSKAILVCIRNWKSIRIMLRGSSFWMDSWKEVGLRQELQQWSLSSYLESKTKNLKQI